MVLNPGATTRKAWGRFDPARSFIYLFARRNGVGPIAGLRRPAFAPLLSMPPFHFASAGRPSGLPSSAISSSYNFGFEPAERAPASLARTSSSSPLLLKSSLNFSSSGTSACGSIADVSAPLGLREQSLRQRAAPSMERKKSNNPANIIKVIIFVGLVHNSIPTSLREIE